jgi:hypothetical protein
MAVRLALLIKVNGSFLKTTDIDQKRRQDLFFAERKMKRRSDQYEKSSAAF